MIVKIKTLQIIVKIKMRNISWRIIITFILSKFFHYFAVTTISILTIYDLFYVFAFLFSLNIIILFEIFLNVCSVTDKDLLIYFKFCLLSHFCYIDDNAVEITENGLPMT